MVELLAPVRDETSFTAAVNAGADAVYFGVGELNMRINSKGIDIKDLKRIVKKAHEKEVKVYVTVNTIVYDNELKLADKILKKIKQSKADAIICWDPAIIEKAKELGLEIHISTQANISNTKAANFYKELGATRIVLARELTLKQIKEIKTDLEIEVFIHGAMCVSVSGRCFMSQFLHGRSANRGDCLQPCRREYEVTDVETKDQLKISNGFVMSPKDLCTLPILDKIVKVANVLKIEGRSRSPEYIKTVTEVYRVAIDAIENKKFNKTLVKKLTKKLEKVYNRGFSTGFLLGRPSPKDWNDGYGSKAKESKQYAGRILNYYKKAKIALVKIESNQIKTGDKIQIHGPTTGVIEFILKEIKGEDKEITFPCEKIVRKNDQVFLIKET
jgi:U32 family peptidase